jgi:hypothetical protein
LGGDGVLRKWIIVVNDRDALHPLLSDVPSEQITVRISFNVWYDVAIGNPIRIHRLPWNRRGIHMHGRGLLALEWNRRSRQYLEVLLHNVEDCAGIDLGYAHEIAHLVFVLDPSDALACHQQTKETALVVLWPFLPNFGAGVEEQSHGGAGGSNAANESKSGQSTLSKHPPPPIILLSFLGSNHGILLAVGSAFIEANVFSRSLLY